MGMEAKYPQPKKKETLLDKSYDELKAKREELIEQGLIERKT